MRHFILVLLIFSVSFVEGQILTSLENPKERALTEQTKDLIIGTWVPEGSNFSERLVFNINGKMVQNSEEDETLNYNWYIQTSTTPSGTILISTLRLQNLNDLNDKIEFEIDTITNEEMVLVYFNGIGLQRTRFFKD